MMKGNNGLTFTSSTGRTVGIIPVPPEMIQQVYTAFEKKNPEPKVPTYTAVTVNDVSELHEHNETTLETDEEKAAYSKWKEEYAKWTAERTTRLIKLFAAEGMTILESDDWIASQEFFDIEVPPVGPARQYHYFSTRVYGNPNDLMMFMSAMMQAQGAPPEQLENAQAMFRTAIQKQSGNA